MAASLILHSRVLHWRLLSSADHLIESQPGDLSTQNCKSPQHSFRCLYRREFWRKTGKIFSFTTAKGPRWIANRRC